MKKRTVGTTAPPLCLCGCLTPLKKGRNGRYASFVRGHNPKVPKSQQPAKTGRSSVNKGQFQLGQSGNPQGRPQGSKHRVTVAAANILEEHASAISERAVAMALDGDRSMIKLILERVVPVKKSVPIRLQMPKIETIADAPKLTGFLLNAVATGKISPADSSILSNTAANHLKALQVSELEARLSELEAQLIPAGE